MVAFQKPITYQGSVTVNSTTSRRSTMPKPPGDKRDHGKPDQTRHGQADGGEKYDLP